MGKITKTYMQTAVLGKPNPWLVPPTNVFAADWIDTAGAALGALLGTGLIASGASFLTTGNIDPNRSVAWGSIAAGIVIVIPIAGDTLSELMADMVEGYYRGRERGQPEPDEPEAEPAPPIEPTEDEAGAARVPGAWWYRTRGGQLRCYYTPASPKDRRPIISDQRMQAIFRLALNGTAFSEDAIRAQVKVSQPRFRILQRDWRKKVLYKLNEDNSGYLTKDGKIVAEAIVNTPLPQSR